MRAVRALLALVLAPVLALAPLRAARAEALIGVNVTNPQWLDARRRAALVEEVAAAGVRVVRLPFTPASGTDYEPTYEMIARLAERGVGVHLVVWPQYPPDAPRRPPGTPGGWPQPPLSAADPARLRALADGLFRRLDAARIRLVGLELDNEINWTEFNGDIPVPGVGRTIRTAELRANAAGRRVLAGFDAYLRSLAALKAARDASRVNRTTPIVSAGLSDTTPTWPGPADRADAVDLLDVLAALRAGGLDRLVDGYGIHTYVGPGLTDEARREHLRRRTLAGCRPAGSGEGKPCWITEWGVPLAAATCPPPDAARLPLVRALRADLAGPARTGTVRALYYYAWDGTHDPLGLHLCGALTESGRAALAPDARPDAPADLRPGLPPDPRP